MANPQTLYDKIWNAHVVRVDEHGTTLLYIDRQLVHEVTSAQAFEGLRLADRKPRRPEANLAVPDHNVPTTDRHLGIVDPVSRLQVETLEANCREFGITLFEMGDKRQGIVHVVGPEEGFTQPGMTIVCGDSHTATHGAFGALAFGIGTSEVEHVLATQACCRRSPRRCWSASTASWPRRDRQGHRAGRDRRDRNGGRHRLRDRVRRRCDPQPEHGRAHDGLQYGHRGRRPRRCDRHRR